MPSPSQRRYARKLNAIAKRYARLEDKTIRQSLALLKDLQAQLAGELLTVGPTWRAHQLQELSRNIDQLVAGYHAQMSTQARTALLQAAQHGSQSALEPLQAAGISGVFLAPTTVQVNVALDFSAELIRAISSEMRNKIDLQIRLSVLGERSPVEAMEKITEILGIHARYGVWAKRRPPARGIAARAETILRTELHRVHNLAHHSQQQEMAERIPGLVKRWIAQGGPRTRPSHLAAHWRYMDAPISVDQPFIVGGAELMYPGDPAGPAAETINCRCRSITLHQSFADMKFKTDKLVAAERERRREQ